MSELFLALMNRSIAAGWLVLAAVILRIVLKKAPKWSHILLWAMVGIRLVCPFSVKSILSLIPSAQVLAPEALYDPAPTVHTGIGSLNAAINPTFSQSFAPQELSSVNPLQIWTFLAGWVWSVGVCVMVLYAVISWLRLHRLTRDAVLLERGIWGSDFVTSPFILGIFRPKIYVPLHDFPATAVLEHEKAHIRRRDHWWKPLGFLLLAVYWFHPLMWLAYILLCRDIELACDEAVARTLDAPGKADYSQALLHCSVQRSAIGACPLAFGEVDVKNRVKSVLHYKKPALWIIILSVLICIVTAVCFLTDPADSSYGTIHGKALTLEDVLRLSERGYDLSWSDLEKYTHAETGSGLYIRQYDIDEMFYLLIGGINPESTPMYIRLCARDGTEDSLDIRLGYVSEFIEAHRDNPIATECSWSFYVCPAGYSRTAINTLLELGGIPENFILSSVRSLPVVKIESVQTLEQFAAALDGELDLNRLEAHMEQPFTQIMQKWNGDFFRKNTLFFCYVTTPTQGYQYSLSYVRTISDTLSIGIVEYEPQDGYDELGGHLLAITVPTEQVSHIQTVDARISAIEPVGGAETANVVGYYVFTGSEEFMKPAVTLYDDGHYSFFFSMISSHFGYGPYAIEGNRLILKDSNGTPLYFFDMEDQKLIFDGKTSSSMVWFSDITDGSVFE